MPAVSISARILIVADDETLRDGAARALALAGYNVVAASDGPDALLAAELAAPIDLLVTGVIMPSMYGDELARQLRTRQPRLRTLYLTNQTEILFRTHPILPDRESFLVKPFTIESLLDSVSSILYGANHQTFGARH